jgi:hypothetical protein
MANRRTGPPRVKLGHQAHNGVAAGLLALVERGAARRPRVARELRGRVEIRFDEDYAPVRLDFADDEVLVEDGNGSRWTSDLVIEGSLPDVIHLATAPLVGGLPRPTHKRGRAALANVAARRVRIEGSPLMARRVMKLLEV